MQLIQSSENCFKLRPMNTGYAASALKKHFAIRAWQSKRNNSQYVFREPFVYAPQ